MSTRKAIYLFVFSFTRFKRSLSKNTWLIPGLISILKGMLFQFLELDWVPQKLKGKGVHCQWLRKPQGALGDECGGGVSSGREHLSNAYKTLESIPCMWDKTKPQKKPKAVLLHSPICKLITFFRRYTTNACFFSSSNWQAYFKASSSTGLLDNMKSILEMFACFGLEVINLPMAWFTSLLSFQFGHLGVCTDGVVIL